MTWRQIIGSDSTLDLDHWREAVSTIQVCARAGSAQQFIPIHAAVYKTFNTYRHMINAIEHRERRNIVFRRWCEVMADVAQANIPQLSDPFNSKIRDKLVFRNGWKFETASTRAPRSTRRMILPGRQEGMAASGRRRRRP